MAMLIVIFGVMAWVKTPTDIFPNIGIPVVAVVWTYNGLPPDDMSGRVIYYYERTLSAQVNDIEHIESQSLPGYGVVKVFFQPTRQHQRRAGADHRGLADGAEAAAAGHHAALRAQLQRLERADPAARALQRFAVRRRKLSTPARTSFARSWRPWPAPPCLRPMAARSARFRSTSTSRSCRPTASPRRTSSTRVARQNLITPVGHRENRQLRIHRRAQRFADAHRRAERPADPAGRRRDGFHARRRARARRQPAADQHRARRRLATRC